MQDETPTLTDLDGLPVWVNDSNKLWSTLRIAQNVPLGRIEWKWKSRGASIRDSSTSAKVLFRISTSINTIVPDLYKEPHDWFRNPYVFVYVTSTIELSDTNEDRSSGWQRVRQFVDLCRQRDFEYIFIMAVSEVELPRHKRVIDKLRAEVNMVSRGPDRLFVVHPAFSPEHAKPVTNLHHSPNHQELLVKLRDFMRAGLDRRLMTYEDAVSRSFLSRSNQSWSYTKHFALKEGLIFVFLHLGRRDLCIKLYDELQKAVTDHSKCGTRRFCDQSASEVASGSTNPDLKEYRSLLLKESITELDLRTYLFARQISILLHDRKYAEIAERGLKFVTAVARRCAEETLKGNADVSAVFRDTWVFITSRLLAATLAPSIPSATEAEHALTAQLSTPRERHTARLIAGFHVHALKAFQGLAHVVLPGCLSQENGDKNPQELEKLVKEAKSTSNIKLRNALSNAENAQVLHSEIANAAASLYEMGGRPRGAAALDGDAGIVRLRNHSYAEAETLLSAQCARFTNDNGWDDLHKRQRLELAQVEKALDKVQEYLVSCLTILYMHRESRALSHRPDFQGSEQKREQAQFWAAETSDTASRLPRVMKYKAERLFDVSVLPNAKKWYEGDPGSAVIRVKSDLPISITIDSVLLECRCVEVRENRKPSLRSRDHDEIPHSFNEDFSMMSTSDSGLYPTVESSASTWNSELSDETVLKYAEKTTLSPGVNDISVHVDEIPRSGCYKITLVAFFIGKLKLVQAASKGQVQQIATTKDVDTSSSGDLITPIADIIDGEVVFPPLFAAPRLPSAYLEVEHVPNLYLVGNALQFIAIKIKVGKNGVRGGSKLSCALQDLPTKRRSTQHFVRFSNKVVSASSTIHENVATEIRPLSDVSHLEESLEICIRDQLQAEEELVLRIGLEQPADHESLHEYSEEDIANGKRCILGLDYACSESGTHTHRSFCCHVEIPLRFVHALDISARLEMRSEWYEPDGSRAVGYGDSSSDDGGTLICSIESRVGRDEYVCLMDITLNIPQWLEQRPEKPQDLIQLLPSTLRGKSVFVFAFDLLVRDALPIDDEDMGAVLNEAEQLRKGVLRRRLSRKLIKSPDMAESQDDFGDLGEDGDRRPLASGDINEQANYEDVAINLEKRGSSPLTTTDTPKTQRTRQPGTRGAEDISELKEAQDVVDLSNPGDESRGLSSGMLTPPIPPQGMPISGSVATLRIGVKLDGVQGEAYVERRISLAALRVIRKRYRVERYIGTQTESGKATTLYFAIQSILGRFSGEEEKHEVVSLHYEIDADPAFWLVVGRRRGQVNISDGVKARGCTTMIPLRCGRHRVPGLRLYTSDGRGLPLSTYDNVDEYMQIVVKPGRTVVTWCATESAEKEIEQKGSAAGSRGTMPDVVASDSFFES
ncbi:Trafficking protein particle complex subunit 10 [Gracilariopsis chorda]|uniref:Trafficking protein particle complex subunit 10 n=1 Tax=Gracilariopsis chorda TaxID=448386 RepID=A0A2V3IZU0_9FLOR|nr:Trafficking protein particle complex subunit 10 [Gracilariopsis chorda]|eukprot:PXF46620.1 Trafficking protein particle complex subunit 10 [Gracilariopsis chorda]